MALPLALNFVRARKSDYLRRLPLLRRVADKIESLLTRGLLPILKSRRLCLVATLNERVLLSALSM
jgi:hypothetical protein